MKRFIQQIIFILLGIVISILLTIVLFPYVPSDTTRLTLINQWVNDENINPEIVIFGDSRAMNGVNGNILSDFFNNVNVVSYSSVGQSFSEAALFYPRIKKSTKIIIQCLDINSLSRYPYLSKDKANTLIMSGFKQDTIYKSFLSQEAYKFINTNKVIAILESRNFLRKGLHTFNRAIIAPNAQSDEIYSIRFPYLFPYERAPEKQYNKYLRSFKEKESKTILTINETIIEKLKKTQAYFRARGINYYLILMPLSPLAWDFAPKNYSDLLLQFENEIGVKIYDFTYLLPDNYFCDPTHLNRAGAKILTEKISVEIIKTQNVHERTTFCIGNGRKSE